MDKLLPRCYAVLIAIVASSVAGCCGHDGTQCQVAEALEQPALTSSEGLAHARLDYLYSHGAKLSFAVAEVEARRYKKNLWRE